jgi:acetoin utilization deacetylase AcuC-like enzyme
MKSSVAPHWWQSSGVELFVVTHPSFALHNTGMWHPERPDRLQAVDRGVDLSDATVRRVEAPPVDRHLLEEVHTRAYIESIERLCREGGGPLDPDTFASEDTFDAAMRAAGAGPRAVELLEGSTPDASAFLAVRPPGHHALAARAMGFCFFNNVVVTARALSGRGAKVAIVDWDVHHGNGTQAMLDADPDLLYLSIHQHPFYPLTGNVTERGVGAGTGTAINAPIPAATGGDVYQTLFDRVFMPVLTQFVPDWILVSAGYDAHEEDPLAEVRLVAADYRWMANRLTTILPSNRIILFLEGGYHLAAIAASVSQTIAGLEGKGVEYRPRQSPPSAWRVVEAVATEAGKRWDVH